jgi:hypothetical protein
MSSQDTWTHPEDARQIKLLRLQIENYRDFIGFLFDPDNDITDWMSESEAWDLFNKNQNPQQ